MKTISIRLFLLLAFSVSLISAYGHYTLKTNSAKTVWFEDFLFFEYNVPSKPPSSLDLKIELNSPKDFTIHVDDANIGGYGEDIQIYFANKYTVALNSDYLKAHAGKTINIVFTLTNSWFPIYQAPTKAKVQLIDKVPIIIGVVCGVVGLIIICVIVWLCVRHARKKRIAQIERTRANASTPGNDYSQQAPQTFVVIQQPSYHPQQPVAYPQQQPNYYPQQQPAAYPQQQPNYYPQQQPAAYPQQQPAYYGQRPY